jgi:hypothetical protein
MNSQAGKRQGKTESDFSNIGAISKPLLRWFAAFVKR